MRIHRSLGIVAVGLVLGGAWPGAVARAQLGDPAEAPSAGRAGAATGSVTITSDPPGAIVTLDGRGIHLVGRTPWTITRGLDGIYTIRSHVHAHEPYESSVYLDPRADETIHLDIAAKTPLKAGMRSLLVPGWGQHYADRDVPAVIYFLSTIGASVYLGITALDYEDQLDDLERAWDAYAESSVQSEREELWKVVERRRADADDAHSDRTVAWAILGAVWGVNLLDSLFFFPDTSSPAVTSSLGSTGLFAEPRADGVELGLRVGY